MALNEKCILFNGGKTIEFSNNESDDNKGLKLTKNDDKTWTLSINAVISEEEAEKIIFKYSDLKPLLKEGEVFEEVFPNMPYFTGLDDKGQSVFVPLALKSNLVPNYDRDLYGTITLKLNIKDFGKTQSSKTQSAAGVKE